MPELLAVVALPPDDLDRIPRPARAMPGRPAGSFLGVVFDRPTSPGNIGTLVRSADAFGAAGRDRHRARGGRVRSQGVRASTGSLFAVPVVRAPSHREVLDWVAAARASGVAVDAGRAGRARRTADLADRDLRGPTLLLVGNETHGLSAAWREACQQMVRIPMQGAASSLNAAASATVALYEVARQRAAGPADRVPYRFATDDRSYADLGSGRVLRSRPGQPAFPVRLAREMFEQALALRPAGAAPPILYDPCCGAGHLLASVGLLYADRLTAVIGSDVDAGGAGAGAREPATAGGRWHRGARRRVGGACTASTETSPTAKPWTAPGAGRGSRYDAAGSNLSGKCARFAGHSAKGWASRRRTSC